ncbi:hypothetical protein [Emticicia soli]|uniref:TonB C-terminal domain-containing protein n=1 Tax=Emticicia soli TaxID=2027878 RepID=A0ABW5JCU1_9BACT
MRFLYLLPILLFLSGCKRELDISASASEEEIVCIFPIQQIEYPEFIGSKTEMVKYILTKIEPYKVEDSRCHKMFISFSILEDGKVEQIEVMKGGEHCPILKEKIIALSANMPKWKPGKIEDKVAKIKMIFPISLDFD